MTMDGKVDTPDSGMELTRRAFGALAGGAAASALLGPMAGAALAQATPKKGGRLRVSMHAQSTNDTFNSAKYVYSNDYIRGTSFYNTLTTLNEKAEAVPSLAESWEPADGGKRWIFKLVKGVRFHDGSPLTTDDVAYSLLRHKDEKLASSAKPLAMNIVSVKGDGPDTIIVELAQPDADLPIVIGTFQFAIIKNGTTDFSSPVGTGPFRIKEFKPGILTSGVRNPEYWRNGRPYVDEFEMFYIIDPVARVNALLAGDVHMASDIKGTGIEEVEKATNVKLFRTAAPRYTVMQSSIDMAPMTNHDLRLAMTYLVDRKRFLETVLKGNGSIANDHPILSDSPLFNTSLPQRELDLDRAKFHLAKSEIGNGRVDLHVSDAAPFSVELALLMQREATRINFNLNVRREPSDSYWNTIPGHRPFYANALNPRPTYNMLLSLTWKSGVAWNFSHYNSPALDGLIDQARVTLDAAKRKQMYWDIQKIIYDAGCYSVPCFMNFVDGVSNKVRGLTPVPVGNLGGFNFSDNVWLES